MPRYLIQTPVTNYTGDLGSVHFHSGRAEVDELPDWLRIYCADQGYSITDQQPDDAGGVPDDDGDPVTPPPGNASAEAWRDHVLALGATADQVDGLSRDQLRELATQLTTTKEEQ